MFQAVAPLSSKSLVSAPRESTAIAARSEAVAAAHVLGSLAGLAMLLLVMLAALFTQTDPYPPVRFAPLFGAALALIVLAVALIRVRSRLFLLPVVPVILIGLLSAGPQKLYPGESDFFAQTPAVYPVILVGTLFIVLLIRGSVLLARAYAAEASE